MGAAFLFVGLSYAPSFAPHATVSFAGLMIFWSFFCSTFIILCDEATNLLEGRSLLNEITASGRAFLRFLAVGVVCGVMLDGVAQWLGKLWIYPFWNAAVYGSTFVIGFCAYWLTLAESYLAAKALLKRWGRQARRSTRAERSGRAWRLYGASGAALMLLGIGLALNDYRIAGGYSFALAVRSTAKVHFAWFLVTFCGLWLLLESVELRQRRDSLLTNLLRGNWLPLASILAASAIFGILMETVNTAHHFWIYTNWPMQRRLFFGVPVAVLLAWPLQYIVFLSVFRVIAPVESRGLWE